MFILDDEMQDKRQVCYVPQFTGKIKTSKHTFSKEYLLEYQRVFSPSKHSSGIKIQERHFLYREWRVLYSESALMISWHPRGRTRLPVQ